MINQSLLNIWKFSISQFVHHDRLDIELKSRKKKIKINYKEEFLHRIPSTMDQYIQDEKNVYILNVSQFHRFYIHLNKLHIYPHWLSIYLFFDRSSLVYVQYHSRIDQQKVLHHEQVNRIYPRKNQID